jgi:hypothetical protein
MVHHDAENGDDPQEEIEARQNNTNEAYQSMFKKRCPFFDEEESDGEPVRDIVIKWRAIHTCKDYTFSFHSITPLKS